MRKVCEDCGKLEHEHHEFVAVMPDGCVCDPEEWGDNVFDVCGEYEGDGEEKRCTRCDHDEACHK